MSPPGASAEALPYRGLAHNNAWANHRLLAACERLPPSYRLAPLRPSGGVLVGGALSKGRAIRAFLQLRAAPR